MCTDCGCSQANGMVFMDHQHSHNHDHTTAAKITNTSAKPTTTVHLEHNILSKNNHIAAHNRDWFNQHGVTVINMMSSPGSGKTTLLSATIAHLKLKTAIIVGDQCTDHDAQQLLAAGANVKQINTQDCCHLDAEMIQQHCGSFLTGNEALVIIENVGNLVCPAAFDLGEHSKVALLSTTEGEEKPLKYPTLFHRADLIVITKTDLIPYLDWDRDRALANIRAVNPQADIIELSAKDQSGFEHWITWLNEHTGDELCA